MLNRACNNAYVQLHAQIAAAFLQLGKHRLARIYVERVYGPLAGHDGRGHDVKFPLLITTGHVTVHNLEDYAKLLAVAARISLAHGQYLDAAQELSQASMLDPLDLEITRQLRDAEDLGTRTCDRYHRRYAKQEELYGSLEKRQRGMRPMCFFLT